MNGEGSDLNKIEALKGRAKRKIITQITMLKLIEIAQNEGEPELEKRKDKKGTAQIYVKALNIILTAMKGKRIFDRFGFNLPKSKEVNHVPAKLLSNYNEWEYDISSSDWLNVMTGEKLCGYEMPSYLNAVLENNINDCLV